MILFMVKSIRCSKIGLKKTYNYETTNKGSNATNKR